MSASTDMFESVHLSSVGLLEPNRRHTFEVPLRYRNIHPIAVQCSLPGLRIQCLAWYKPSHESGFRLPLHKGLLTSQPCRLSSSDICICLAYSSSAASSRLISHFPCRIALVFYVVRHPFCVVFTTFLAKYSFYGS